MHYLGTFGLKILDLLGLSRTNNFLTRWQRSLELVLDLLHAEVKLGRSCAGGNVSSFNCQGLQLQQLGAAVLQLSLQRLQLFPSSENPRLELRTVRLQLVTLRTG